MEIDYLIWKVTSLENLWSDVSKFKSRLLRSTAFVQVPLSLKLNNKNVDYNSNKSYLNNQVSYKVIIRAVSS